MMRKGLESHFEVMAERGEAIPEPVITGVELKDEDFENLEFFVVERLEVKVPDAAQKPARLTA